jgi:hypothetical protein
VRGEAWSGLIGNGLRINSKLYASLLVRVSYAETNIDEDDQFKKNIKVIEVDLHRTFSDLGQFRSNGLLH